MLSIMKRFAVALLCALLLSGVIPAVGTAEAVPFCIMTSAEWTLSQETVDRLAKARVIRVAATDTPASAEVSMSRATFAVILLRGLGLPGQPAPDRAPFADMEGHWARADVALLVQEGIVRGNPDGRFRPDDPITLNEVKLMLARALRLGADLTLEGADKALRYGGIDTIVPCRVMPYATLYQAFILLDRALSTPYYARFETMSELRIRPEFAAGVIYESEDGTRIEAPSWAQIEAELARVRGGANSFASLTAADGSAIRMGGGPSEFLVERSLPEPDGSVRHLRADGGGIIYQRWLTIGGATVVVPPGHAQHGIRVASLFRAFMLEDLSTGGWVEVTEPFR